MTQRITGDVRIQVSECSEEAGCEHDICVQLALSDWVVCDGFREGIGDFPAKTSECVQSWLLDQCIFRIVVNSGRLYQPRLATGLG